MRRARRIAALALAPVLSAAALASAAVAAEPASGLAAADRVRLAEAFRLAEACAEEVWPGWTGAPFEVLLVTEEREFLLRAAETAAGFERIGESPDLGGAVYARPRVFPPDLLATFPALGATPTVVVGTAEATDTGSTQWVAKILHEHFHQLQMSAPGYYDEADALGLADGDDSGHWMLEYPFPYDSPEVGALYAELSREVARGLAGDRSADADVAGVWRRLADLRRALSEKDFNYLSFQLWQEGICRYVELRVAECAARGFPVAPSFAALPDFEGFAAFAARLRRAIFASLAEPQLAEEKRVAFYDLGAGLGLLLDRTDGGWKKRYLERKFFLVGDGERAASGSR